MHVHSFILASGLSSLALAAIIPKELLAERAVNGICDALPEKWSYQGCYTDSPQARVLASDGYNNNNGLSQETCIEYCDQRGYPLAGVEYGSECYCGYQLKGTATKSPDSSCNKKCSGNDQENCGGAGYMNVFWNGDAPPTAPQSVNGYTLQGCYADSPSSRILPNSVDTQHGGDSMSVEDCTSACAANGYSYAGLEYARECYCATSLPAFVSPVPCNDGCNMACTGNRQEYCGGAARISIYKNPSIQAPVAAPLPSGWTTMMCYSDSPSSRTLPTRINLSSPTTVEGCLNGCHAQGFSYGGVEYGNECYCGNDSPDTSLQATDGCNMACEGNKAEKCGGPGRINLYQYTPSTGSTSPYDP